MPRPSASSEQTARAERLRATLTAQRHQLGIDLEQLARTAQVNRRTLDKFFQGPRAAPAPSFFLVMSMARALQLSLDDLADRVDTSA